MAAKTPETVDKFAAIILAAGLSRRYGAANKLLAPYNGKPVLAHLLDTVCGAGFHQVIAVTGHEREQVQGLLSDYNVMICHNDAYQEGMGKSIACGASALDDNAEGIFLFLGDMPHLSGSILGDMLTVYRNKRSRCIIRPTYQKQPGHPVLFPAAYKARLCTLKGDTGAKDILVSEAQTTVLIDYPDDAVIRDIDRPSDLN